MQHVEPSYALRLLEEQPERVGYLLKQRVFDAAVLVAAVENPALRSRIQGLRPAVAA